METKVAGQTLVLVGRACAFLLAALFGACMTQAAGALDLNTWSAVPAPKSNDANWQGFYLHNNAVGTGSVPWMNQGPANAAMSADAPSHWVNESFGYNFQSGNFVFGLEGSLAAANIDGRFTSPGFAPMAGWTPNTNWLGTVTGRLGYSFGQWLPYVKGGFASADVGSPLQGSPVNGFSQSATSQTGWTAGLGLEYQLSSKWSLGLEYLYTDLSNGGASGPQGALGSGGSPEVYSTAVKSQSLLGRLNYKAGW
jgi:opacity protein-like surface antigen